MSQCGPTHAAARAAEKCARTPTRNPDIDKTPKRFQSPARRPTKTPQRARTPIRNAIPHKTHFDTQRRLGLVTEADRNGNVIAPLWLVEQRKARKERHAKRLEALPITHDTLYFGGYNIFECNHEKRREIIAKFDKEVLLKINESVIIVNEK